MYGRDVTHEEILHGGVAVPESAHSLVGNSPVTPHRESAESAGPPTLRWRRSSTLRCRFANAA